MDLPNFNEDEEAKHLSPDEIRRKLKEKGMLPPRPWQERTMSIGCTGGVFEEYVPPEGDGKVSIVSTTVRRQWTAGWSILYQLGSMHPRYL